MPSFVGNFHQGRLKKTGLRYMSRRTEAWYFFKLEIGENPFKIMK